MADCFEVHMTDTELDCISSLGLAHIGDAVYELMVRTWLALGGEKTAGGLHRETVARVAAPAQARAAERILPLLTEQELAVFRRGRNTKVKAIPHGATTEEYHTATALEALFGWLFLQGGRERLNTLFSAMTEVF